MSGQNPDGWGTPPSPSGQPASGDQSASGQDAAQPPVPPPAAEQPQVAPPVAEQPPAAPPVAEQPAVPQPAAEQPPAAPPVAGQFAAPGSAEQPPAASQPPPAPPAYGQFASAAPPTPSGAFPTAPAYGMAAPARPTAPPTVVVTFWLWIVSAVFLVYSAIRNAIGASYVQSQFGPQIDQLRESGMNSAEIDGAIRTAIWFAVVLLVVVAVIMTLSAFQMKAGRNWARILGVVFAAFGAIVGIFALFTIQGLIALVCIASIVCVFLPPSNQYFAATRRLR